MVPNYPICPNCRQQILVEENNMCSTTISVNNTRCMMTGIRTNYNSFSFKSRSKYVDCQDDHSSSASQKFLGTICRCDNNNLSNPPNTSESSKFCFNLYLPVPLQSCEHFVSFINPGWKTRSVALLTFTVILLLLPTTMSNPLPGSSGSGHHHRHHNDRNRIHERPAKWINPCRIPSPVSMLSSNSETEIQTVPDKDIFHHIITQAAKAEKQASEFKEDFYKEAFGEEDTYNYKTRDSTHDWLKDIMDIVNTDLNQDTISNLPVEDTIKNVYKGLQKFAVGLEAIVLDQACYGGSFYQHFNEAEYQLKYVLCELQIAMIEKNIFYEDITRDIMAQEFRDVPDKANRNFRDWMIFRDYVETLKYVQKAFHLYYEHAATNEALETNGANLRS